MAGIGVNLKKIYSKHTIVASLGGAGYSTVITIAPMIMVILAIVVMQKLLDFTKVGYAERALYSSTILYIFIFALLTAAPFNAVLSRYVADIFFRESYGDILPCYYFGMVINIVFSTVFAIPFCIREHLVGDVEIPYVFAGYCGYTALILVFYSMLYMSACKDYKKISFFFFVGMTVAVLLSLVFVKIFHAEVTFGMLLALDVGFLLIASLEQSLIRSYFREDREIYGEIYHEVGTYFKRYWQLVITNFLYILGLYLHNFVFWTTELRMVVAKSFVSAEAYDMATYLAMLTNISSTTIFISGVEMHFHERYKRYSEAIIGGRGMDIKNAERRVFRQLADELMNLVRMQFIISVVTFFLGIIFLPRMGLGGLVTQIYPCLAGGYFILFVMYAEIIFLYYFNDWNGAMVTAFCFAAITLSVSIFATRLSPQWYGIGLVAGALAGWSMAYFRLRTMEKNMYTQVFCRGTIMKRGHGARPTDKVYGRRAGISGKRG